jgi:hypothetical protein
MQPGAIATVAKTLKEKGRPPVDRVELHISQKAGNAALSLERFLIDSLRISVTTVVSRSPSGDHKTVVESIRQHEREGSIVYFNCSAGLSYFVAKVSRELRDSKVRPVYASYDHLYWVGTFEFTGLLNIGIEELLNLHQLSIGTGGEARPGIWKDLVINAAHENVLSCNYAYEKGGRLYCLVENIDSLSKARELIAIKRKEPRLEGLVPHITAEVFRKAEVQRLRMVEIDALLLPGKRDVEGIRENVRKRQQWFDGQRPTPGSAALESGVLIEAGKVYQGSGGDGPSLVVSLGADPSSTLQAIRCHMPNKAWILYDKTTAYVGHLASRLARHADLVSAGELRFSPVDHAGGGMDSNSIRNLLENEEKPVHVSVTPGSKAQSWALAQLPDDLALPCSIITKGGNRAVTIERDIPCRDSGPESIPVLDLAALKSGNLQSAGVDVHCLAAKAKFLLRLAEECAIFVRSRTSHGLIGFSGRKGKLGSMVYRWSETEAEKILDISIEAIKPRGHFKKRCKISGQITFRKDPESGEIKYGYWLEEVVGQVMAQAGLASVHIGMKWDWPTSRAQRTEIDVTGSWQGRYPIGISVKASTPSDDARRRQRMEIAAMVHECFGRFALPILVSAMKNDDLDPEKMVRKAIRTGVLEIGIGRLDRPDLIAEMINNTFDGLRTS